MKPKINFRGIADKIKKLVPRDFRLKPFLAAAGAFLFTLAVVMANMNAGSSGENPDEFEAGKVAERDVIAEHSFTYEDTEATRLKSEAQERLVPAVFHYSAKAAEDMQNNWKNFTVLAADHFNDTESEFIAAVRGAYPEYFSNIILSLFFRSPDRQKLLDQATQVFNKITDSGIFEMPPDESLERLNPDTAELIRSTGTRVERERVSYSSIYTLDKISSAVHDAAGSLASPESVTMIENLTEFFFAANVIFSQDETVARVMETRAKTEPVMNYIERGKKVIRKGFIITEEDMTELGVLNMSMQNDIRLIFSRVLLLLLVFSSLFFFCGKRIIGRDLRDQEVYLICILSALYISGTILTRSLTLSMNFVPVSLFIPTALVVMLIEILIHPRLALFLAIALPLGAYFSDAYDASSLILALVSGASASFVLQGAEKRMDLVKAGLIIAALNCVAIIAIMLGQGTEAAVYPGLIFWAAFNGIASGMLVFGFLPPLEQALSAATTFRLIELSDLNAPILRRLFTTAPGTYSHSIMVANLAETACQDIGANSFLARVGAYYHDIGKMENPQFFVENQTDVNPHDGLTPKHSVTILRNHVKLGVEKARQLKLPRDVMEIIADHHGNSIITWFYSKALKQQESSVKKTPVNPEDYSYQGSPPKSRESAVVMLADMTEAAVRTLDKPTQTKMETFVQELISAKMESGQLARSELTFRDMETIKQAFVRMLMSYNHSRIAYPKIDITKPPENDE
ncbi:MAG: HDIG domain-containing protein [Treponema sp.]|nr:HDIG domain-containing protein [Treponema sp.]